MTATVSIPSDVASRILDVLRAQQQTELADSLDKALHPPTLWVLRGPADEDGYETYLGRNRYDIEHGRYATDPDSCPWQFTTADNAELFTDEQKASFDGAAILAAYISDEDDSLKLFDFEAEDVRECLIDSLDWELAPTRDDGADAFASGATELDFCEALIALGERADALRAA